jgi:hypothetical protein
LSGQSLPLLYRHVDKGWFDLDSRGPSASPLSSEDGCPRSRKRIEDKAPTVRAITDRVTNQGDRFHGRMILQIGISRRPEAVCAWIVPDIGSVSPVLPEFDIVDVPGSALLEDYD